MASTIELEVATPERSLLRESVSEVQIPGLNGYLGVLPEHAPLLTVLGNGVLSYTQNGQVKHIAVSGGFAEVLPDQVRVLANRAEYASEIDIERAQRALQRAQERLNQTNPSVGVDLARALDSLYRAQARIETAGKR